MGRAGGEFFELQLNARREGDQLVSIASFRMDGRRREYQVEVRLPVGGSWYHDALRVDLPETWDDTAEVNWFVRAAAGPGYLGGGSTDAREHQFRIRVPFELKI